MPKRLFMTSADYVAIAVSPALIMALVGSLVFFLIEVAYVGDYQARLTYAFALFVFAAVLIARIAIEMGSDRAAIFALPLALVMFLFLLRFVEHASPFSHVINLALMGLVWWCAHRLTWDSTVIDDDEDASGEGLLQRIGVDGPEPAEPGSVRDSPAGQTDNELLQSAEQAGLPKRPWWQRLILGGQGAHTPGIWVFYFSMAALPLFGIGQRFIPVADVARRRYVFALLLVYVAAALCLLVTTSFLNLRRYLRQRRVEMPLSIAGTWVGTGVALILLVMLVAMLIPRPNAEVAISRVPWQATSPGGHSASPQSLLRDGGEKQDGQHAATADADAKTADDGQPGELQKNGQPSTAQPPLENTSDEPSSQPASQAQQNGERQTSDQQSSDPGAEAILEEKAADPGNTQPDSKPPGSQSPNSQQNATQGLTDIHRSQSLLPTNIPKFGGLAALIKILFYVFLAIIIAYLAWRYRRELARAWADILRQLRELFSGKRDRAAPDERLAAATATRLPSFSEFHDPFAAGRQGKLPPEELVRYTFAAFEAWARDRGSPRSPDRTPQELLSMAVEPEAPMYSEARRLIRLYSQVAYASQRVPPESADQLKTLWQLMRTTAPVAAAATPPTQ